MPTSLSDKIIVSIDPGYATCGVSVFNGNKLLMVDTIKPNKMLTHFQKLLFLSNRLKSIIEKYPPDVYCYETQYISIPGSAVIKLIEARTMMLATVLFQNPFVQVVEVTATEAKKAVGVTGKLKRAESKIAVKKLVLQRFPTLERASQDAIDSVAIGIAAISKHSFR